MNKRDIKVYTKTGCPWCVDLIRFLNGEMIQFEEIEVLSDPEKFQEMQEISGQTKAPTVIIGGVVYPDTDKDQISRLLTL